MKHSGTKCENCGKLARIIFFNEALKKVVDYCWSCFDLTGKGK